jgi:predicted oxidoreductase
MFIGEWAEARGIRDQLFIATKVGILLNAKETQTIQERWHIFLSQYTSNFKRHDESVSQKVLYNGNSAKSLHVSIEQSLKKLRTSYIDLLYLHWWDWDTSVEEVMRALHILVLQGKVLYLVSSIFHHGYYHPPHGKGSKKLGSFRYPCLGCIEGKSIRAWSCYDSVCDLPRCLERDGPFIRTRNHSYGSFGG